MNILTLKVIQKIGENEEVGTVFKGRQKTGEVTKIYKDKIDTPKDYVTTRIIRLAGLEEGINKGEGVDSKKRYIYIHGTHEEGLIGEPVSHGCIRMKNDDVIKLFDMVSRETLIEIQDK